MSPSARGRSPTGRRPPRPSSSSMRPLSWDNGPLPDGPMRQCGAEDSERPAISLVEPPGGIWTPHLRRHQTQRSLLGGYLAVLIGRAPELAAFSAFLDDIGSGPSSIVIKGPAGIGKTAVWTAGLAEAGRSCRILSSRPAEPDAHLSFAGLTDLVGDVVDEVGDRLPAPQREALEIVLLRREVGAIAIDERAIGTAVRTILVNIASAGPVVIAVDDLQWLDPESERAIDYALRRLRTETVGFAGCLLSGTRSDLASEVAR